MKALRSFINPALLIGVIAMLGLGGCGKEPRKAVGLMDTPQHHTGIGHDFIEKGNWKEAGKSFDLAIGLGKDHGPAFAGKAIVVAHGATAGGLDAEQREKLFEQADDLVDQALDKAETPGEKRAAHVAGIRVHRLTKVERKWLVEAEEHYEDAVKLDKRRLDPDPHFYMARAYRDAFEVRKAVDLYRKVLGMNSRKSGMATTEMALVQKVIRAEPGSRHGRVIAFAPSISRADIAALFIEELRLERLYQRGNTRRFDTGFKPPTQDRKFEADKVVRAAEVTDIARHPLRADILAVIKLRVAGLQPDARHRFYPNQPLRRAQFAMMVQDILVKVTGEKGLATKFVGQASPFGDVRGDHFSFNAIVTVTSRGLMEPLDKIKGDFGPKKPVHGADALLVIRLLNNQLRRYIR